MATTERITKKDLEDKFRELEGEATQTARSARSYVLAAGAVAAVGVLAVAFLTGRRRGRKNTTVVEITRI